MSFFKLYIGRYTTLISSSLSSLRVSCFNRYISNASNYSAPGEKFSLYLIADRQSIEEESVFFFKIREAVRGGAMSVQYRDHKSDLSTAIKTAKYLKDMLSGTGVPLIINTLQLLDVASAIKPEGIYLEKTFFNSELKATLGRRVSIGGPLNTEGDMDYISVKVFSSKHANPYGQALDGIEELRKIRKVSAKPLIAIGDINIANAEFIYKEVGFCGGIAMAGDLLREESPYAIARQMQAIRQNVFSKP